MSVAPEQAALSMMLNERLMSSSSVHLSFSINPCGTQICPDSKSSLITGLLLRFAPSMRETSFVADAKRNVSQARAVVSLLRNQAGCAQ
jgi:hypothetical protein